MASGTRVVAIHQPELLPWLGFLDKLQQCNVFVLLDHVQFEKHYFQNRNRIRTATPQGWSWLTVPVRMTGRFGQPIHEVEIGNTSNWRRKHLAAIELNYRRAPAFQQSWPTLQALYARPWDRLAEFSIALIRWMAEAFGIQTPIVRSSELRVEGARSDLLRSICRQVKAGEYLSGISGRDYLDVGSFEREGITVRFQSFYHPIYRQCYKPFVPALSGLDLLMNYGEESLGVLEGAGVSRLSTVFT